MKKKRKIKGSIIIQVGLMFALCVILTGILTYNLQYAYSGRNVVQDTEERSADIAHETFSAIREYPAYRWLLTYWQDNAYLLDIEYDVDYNTGTKTKEKCQLLNEHAPDFQIKYATESEVEALSPEDQKLYAEITYSWLITHVNEIKRNHHSSFLFLVQTEAPYHGQFFIFSAADPGAVRGTLYEQVYTLGVTVKVSQSQQRGMISAKENSSYVADAGKYIDYYAYLESIGERDYLVGITYDQSEKLADVEDLTSYGTILTVGCLILLSVLFSIAILLFVLRPLKKIQTNIRLYQETKNSEPVIKNLEKIKMYNEMGELSYDVIQLTKEIDDYLEKFKTITAQEERLQAELTLAMNIQTSLLPHTFPPFPDRTEFDIFASMDPARAVGGDFYDFFLVDDDHLGMVIADVSGKGIPAALFMMIAKIIIKNSAMSGRSVSEVLTKANEVLFENNQAGMFVTVWIGILEISTGKLTAASAGHEYPVIKKPDSGFELLKDKHGFVIGIMKESKYTEYELQLEPGSKIFVYTDGVPEATNADHEFFGTERMLQALNSEPEASPENILKNTRRSVDDFVKDAEQFDDLTMLCLEYKKL